MARTNIEPLLDHHQLKVFLNSKCDPSLGFKEDELEKSELIP